MLLSKHLNVFLFSRNNAYDNFVINFIIGFINSHFVYSFWQLIWNTTDYVDFT